MTLIQPNRGELQPTQALDSSSLVESDLVEIWEEADQGAFYDFAKKSYSQLEVDEKSFREAWKNLICGMDEAILKRLPALNLERVAAEAQGAQQKSAPHAPSPTKN